MRVIAGNAKGRKLKTLDGLEVRPTTDKVKEAIFSSIQFELPGAIVLDLFSGSGQMGIEAISCGAKQVAFVDCSSRSLDVTRENLTQLDLLQQAQLYLSDASAFLQTTAQQFDIAILDPPYRKGILSSVLPILETKLRDGGIVICEHEVGLKIPETVESLVFQKQRKYSAVLVTTYRCRRGET